MLNEPDLKGMERDQLEAIALQQRKALENCMLMALREIRRARHIGSSSESWEHVLRFCKDAGCELSILREPSADAESHPKYDEGGLLESLKYSRIDLRELDLLKIGLEVGVHESQLPDEALALAEEIDKVIKDRQ